MGIKPNCKFTYNGPLCEECDFISDVNQQYIEMTGN